MKHEDSTVSENASQYQEFYSQRFGFGQQPKEEEHEDSDKDMDEEDPEEQQAKSVPAGTISDLHIYGETQ